MKEPIESNNPENVAPILNATLAMGFLIAGLYFFLFHEPAEGLESYRLFGVVFGVIALVGIVSGMKFAAMYRKGESGFGPMAAGAYEMIVLLAFVYCMTFVADKTISTIVMLSALTVSSLLNLLTLPRKVETNT